MPEDFDEAFASTVRDPPDAILMVSDILTFLNRRRVYEFAAEHRLPAVYERANYVRDGGLSAYSPDLDEIYDRATSVPGAIGTTPICPGVVPPPVIAYTSGPATGNAVYDCNTGYTWLANANLAAQQTFGISGTTTIDFGRRSIAVPLIHNGALLFATAMQWIDEMNTNEYLGSSSWQMHASSAVLGQLFSDLRLASGDARFTWTGSIGPFRNLQPSFYWSCQRDQSGGSDSPCTGFAPPDGATRLQWTFDFDYGFQSTSAVRSEGHPN